MTESNSFPFREWLGHVEEVEDTITAGPLRLMSATLDRDDPLPVTGTAVPPLWHWLYFLPGHAHSNLGQDGHPRRGGFLPPVPLPRRMWAGGELTFNRPLLVGQTLHRRSTIQDIRAKSGRSGELVFVRVHHEIGDENGPAIIEDHDIVYRDMPSLGAAARDFEPSRDVHQFSCVIKPDPVLLFRYSALTFNGHRIHYDRPYTVDKEGYPGLVVHGPLIATLLLELLGRERPNAGVAAFRFRAVSPVFDIERFMICGRIDTDVATLWARTDNGVVAMRASVSLTRKQR